MTTKTAPSALSLVDAFMATLRGYLDGELTDRFSVLGFNDRGTVERFDLNAQALVGLREQVLTPAVEALFADPALSYLTDDDRRAVTAALDECVRVFHAQLVSQGSAAFTDSKTFATHVAAVNDVLIRAAVAHDVEGEQAARDDLAAAEAGLTSARDQLEAAIRAVDIDRVNELRKAVVVDLPAAVDEARHRVLTLTVARLEAEVAPFAERSEAASVEADEAQAAAVAADEAFKAAIEHRDIARVAQPIAYRAAEEARRRVDAAKQELEAHEAAQAAARVQRFRVMNGV